VTSISDDKLGMAKPCGAVGGFNIEIQNGRNKQKKETGGFDIIIDSAGVIIFQN